MIRRLLISLSILSLLLTAPFAALAQLPGGVQVPGTGSLPTTVPSVPSMPSKDALLQQAKGMVTDLTSMKSSGKLNAAQAVQVDGMLPKAQSLTSELAKPQIPPSKLTQLATSVSDLQQQMTTLKGLVK